MIAIETKFHGPTNHRGSRVSAVCVNCHGRVYVGWDHALGSVDNHRAAAVKHLEHCHRSEGNGDLRAKVDAGHAIRSGYVFPLVSCEPY